MRHGIIVVLLALGTVGGFAAGFASLHAHHRGCCAGHDTHASNAPAEPGP